MAPQRNGLAYQAALLLRLYLLKEKKEVLNNYFFKPETYKLLLLATIHIRGIVAYNPEVYKMCVFSVNQIFCI